MKLMECNGIMLRKGTTTTRTVGGGGVALVSLSYSNFLFHHHRINAFCVGAGRNFFVYCIC
jgi:hypothetical protein